VRVQVTRPSQVFLLLRQADTRGTAKSLAHVGFTVLKKEVWLVVGSLPV
jgi:hypothetical protein